MKLPAFRNFIKKHYIKILTPFLIAPIIVSIFYLYRLSGQIRGLERDRILAIASTAAALIHIDDVEALEGNESDLERPEYRELKSYMIKVRKIDPLMRFSYIMRRTENGEYIILLDSDPLTSKDYSPPGQVYSEIAMVLTEPFIQGNLLVAGPVTDRWGTWISAYVPIKNAQTGNIEAVLGIDYPAELWHSLIVKRVKFKSLILSFWFCLIAAIIIFIWIHIKATDIKRTLESNSNRLSIFLDNFPGMAFEFRANPKIKITFVSKGCTNLTEYTPKQFMSDEFSFSDLIAPEYRKEEHSTFKEIIKTQVPINKELEIITKNNERKWVFGYGQFLPGNTEIFEGVFVDITDRKKAEERNKYLNDHDTLTGLYNRRYFTEALPKMDLENLFPISFIIGNINGLGLFNNAFGEKKGDELLKKAGELLRYCAPQNAIIARLGEDDFALALPLTDKEKRHTILDALQHELEQYHLSRNSVEKYLNFSFGYATTDHENDFLPDVLRNAKKMLQSAKLLNKASTSHGILSSMLATLYERSGETEEHSTRLACISIKIARYLGLSDEDLNMLKLFAMLHDIGKIGIDDRILKKPGPLTEEEWKIMRTHPQIGYRIAMASNEFKSVAPYILSHHERWDGTGYPRGLKGEEIPLLSRILSVVDAFDAMISKRVYKEAWSLEKALEEIKKDAGTQFDPKIVDIFMDVIKSEGR